MGRLTGEPHDAASTRSSFDASGYLLSPLRTPPCRCVVRNGARGLPTVGIEVAQLNRDELDALAKKTTCLITTVGPYHEFGAPVVEACAANGTHYLDCTGEAPWLRDMIGKYHEQAKASGAIVGSSRPFLRSMSPSQRGW